VLRTSADGDRQPRLLANRHSSHRPTPCVQHRVPQCSPPAVTPAAASSFWPAQMIYHDHAASKLPDRGACGAGSRPGRWWPVHAAWPAAGGFGSCGRSAPTAPPPGMTCRTGRRRLRLPARASRGTPQASCTGAGAAGLHEGARLVCDDERGAGGIPAPAAAQAPSRVLW